MIVLLAFGRLLLGAILIGAGVAKLADRSGTRQMMVAFGAPAALGPALSWSLPVVEVLCGAALLVPATAALGAAGTLGLLGLFLVAIGWNLARGRHPECRCFGQLHTASVGWRMVLRNLGLGTLAGLILLRQDRSNSALVGWSWPLTVGESVALGAALIGCVLAAGGAWLLLSLLKQHGRLLLRMDALEARLAGVPEVAPEPELAEGAPHFGLPIGAVAPGFVLPNLAGTMVSLDELRNHGRPVVLLFVDPGCGPCASLVPEVATWRARHAHTLTIALLSGGTAEANRERFGAREAGVVLLQGQQRIADSYRAYGTPSAVVVDMNGRLASPVAQGAAAIRRLVRDSARPAAARVQDRRAAAARVATGMAVATVALLGAGATPEAPDRSHRAGWVLEVEGPSGWAPWWRSDSAPEVWSEPLPAVLSATRWKAVAKGVDLGELVVSGGSLSLRTRIVLGRFDPRLNEMVLVSPRASGVGRATWTIDSAGPGALLAFNAGQFRDGAAWGWLIRNGRELQAPGRGPLSMTVAVTRAGAVQFVSPESLPALRAVGGVREAFQSFPALLVGQGRVPEQLRRSGPLIDLAHRDARLSLCQLHDGRLLVTLTRFDNLGRIFGGLPIGLTLDETAAVMGALGCRRAVSLDGGLSAQLRVHADGGRFARWAGSRMVPLGIEVRPRS
jgi:uncharacterized membrane protein YphA (DoxX/SURF4 family)